MSLIRQSIRIISGVLLPTRLHGPVPPGGETELLVDESGNYLSTEDGDNLKTEWTFFDLITATPDTLTDQDGNTIVAAFPDP